MHYAKMQSQQLGDLKEKKRANQKACMQARLKRSIIPEIQKLSSMFKNKILLKVKRLRGKLQNSTMPKINSKTSFI